MSGRRSALLALVLAGGLTLILLAIRSSSQAEAASASAPARATPAVPAGEAGTVPGAMPSATRDQQLKQGEELYLTSCVSCHGVRGVGGIPDTAFQGGMAPALTASGEASADFMLRTGRMPMTIPAIQPPGKPVAYTDEQIQALVVYVGSLCDSVLYDCPAIPDVRTNPEQLADGGALFLANCAPCHNSVAIGGALSRGRHAPSLQQTAATQVGEAMRTGPGDMPQFGPDVFTDEQVDAIVTYVEYLHQPEHPGGAPLGYTGPVAEGFVALLIGLGALIVAIRWITREHEPDSDAEVAP